MLTGGEKRRGAGCSLGMRREEGQGGDWKVVTGLVKQLNSQQQPLSFSI
jgi:hypothetical protein